MWAYSLSVVALAATLQISEAKSEASDRPAKEFHTFREVQVYLRDPEQPQGPPILLTEKSDGHHIGSLNLEVQDMEASVLFEIDLTLNRELIPTNYFQKYHKKVSHQKIAQKTIVSRVRLPVSFMHF